MPQVIDIVQTRLITATKKGYRNWSGHFKEEFGIETRLSQISTKTLATLAQGREKGTFYLYDLIMNLKGLGSGFEFLELSPPKKIIVIDLYLFLLDQIRFECMKRLEWLESYPDEKSTLVELIVNFNKATHDLQTENPELRADYPDYKGYSDLNTFDKEVFIRKLIPAALDKIQEIPRQID